MRGGKAIAVLFFSSIALLASACSSSGGSGAGGACANYVAALRDSSKECGHFNVSPSRESDYMARFQRACESALAAPGSGIAPNLLDQCAAKIRETCGDDDACEELFDDVRGSLADGTACDDDTQCASGECKTESSAQSGGRGCGTCAAAKQIGEACPDGGCVAGATCRTSINGTSTEQVCVAVRTVGAGESCGSTSGNEAIRCGSGFYCKTESSSSSVNVGTCTAPADEGAACGGADGQYARCKAPLSCVNERCGRLLGAGQTCQDSGDCASGLGCDGSQKCTAIVWGANGAECDDNLRRCDRGFCSRPIGTGGTSNVGKCADYIADGQPCDAEKSLEQRCDSLSRCIDGTCQFPDPAQCK